MAELIPTPSQTVGPFFGYALPYPHDNELVPPGTLGAIRLTGRVLDGAGEPIPDALVEIRQADAEGRIPRQEGSLRRGGAFTGWGRSATDPAGRFSFTTVEPGGVDGGVAFISVLVFARGLLDGLFTRAYLPGPEEQLATDPLLASVSPERRATLMAAWAGPGELVFDLHLQGPQESTFLSFPRHRE